MIDRQRAFVDRLTGSPNRVYWSGEDIRRIAHKFGLKDGAAELRSTSFESRRRAAAASSKPIVGLDPKATRFVFTINTARIDSYDDIVYPAGAQLSRFNSNPVVLEQHDHRYMPVGRATRTWLEGGRLKSSSVFSPSDHGQRIQTEIQRGFLSTASIGFIPIRWEWSKDASRPYGVDHFEWELIEWSVVSVPANEDCRLEAIVTYEESERARAAAKAEIAKREGQERKAARDEVRRVRAAR